MDRNSRHTNRYLQASKESLSNMSHQLHISGEKLTSSTRDLVQISTEMFSPQSIVNLNKQKNTRESEDMDSRFSWVIMLCCGVLQVVSLSSHGYAGIILVELVEVYPEKRLTVIWLTSILNAAVFFAGPLAAVIIDRASARICSTLGSIGAGVCLFIVAFTSTFELFCVVYPLTGVFGCMMFIPASTHCVKFFKKYRVLVLMGTTCFVPLCFIILPPAVTAIVKAFGWRESVMFAAALNMQVTVLSMLLREPTPPRLNQQESVSLSNSDINSDNTSVQSNYKLHIPQDDMGTEQSLADTKELSVDTLPRIIISDTEKCPLTETEPSSKFVLENVDSESLLISNSQTHKDSELPERLSDYIDQSNHELQRRTVLHWRVFATVFATFLWGWGSAAYFVLLPIYSKDLGYRPGDTSILYIVAGIGSAVSRLASAGISQCIEFNKSIVTLLSMVLMAIALFSFSVVKNLVVFSMGVAMYYIAYGLVSGFATAVILEMHGEYKVEMVFSLQMFSHGLGLLVAPPFAENFNCSCIGLYVGCGVTAVGGLLYLPHIILHYCRRRPSATTSTR